MAGENEAVRIPGRISRLLRCSVALAIAASMVVTTMPAPPAHAFPQGAGSGGGGGNPLGRMMDGLSGATPAPQPPQRDADTSDGDDPSDTDPSAAQREALKELHGSIAEIDEALDAVGEGAFAELFEPSQLAARLGGTPRALFDWVRNQTVLVPYAGALRGAEGVLRDGDGNSLDRSLLLAELLAASAFRVELARASLPPGQVNELLEANADRVSRFDVLFDQLPRDADEPSLQRLEDELARNRVTSQSGDLLALVETHRVPEVQLVNQEREAALAALTDHWWVRADIDGAWVDLDVTLDEIGERRAVPEGRKTPQAVVAEQGAVNTVAFRLVLNAWDRTNLVENELLEVRRPAVALAGVPIRLEHRAVGLDPDGGPQIFRAPEDLATVPAWLPVLTIGDEAMFGRVVESSGALTEPSRRNLERIIARALTAKGEAGIGDRLLPLTDGQNGGLPPAAEAFASAAALFLEVEVVGTRGTEVIRRPLFDVSAAGPGSASRHHRYARALGFATDVSLAVETSKLDPLRETKRLAGQFSTIQRLFAAVADPPADGALGELALDQVNAALQVDLTAFTANRWRLNPFDAEVFVDRPNVTALWRKPAADDGEHAGIAMVLDVMANGVGVRPWPSLDPFAARLTQGVADTAAEARALFGAGPVRNMTVRHAAAAAVGEEFVVVDRGDEPGIARIAGASPPAPLLADLAGGFVVAAPPEVDGDPPQWWRVDPATGSSLGVGEGGHGATATFPNAGAVSSPAARGTAPSTSAPAGPATAGNVDYLLAAVIAVDVALIGAIIIREAMRDALSKAGTRLRLLTEAQILEMAVAAVLAATACPALSSACSALERVDDVVSGWPGMVAEVGLSMAAPEVELAFSIADGALQGAQFICSSAMSTFCPMMNQNSSSGGGGSGGPSRCPGAPVSGLPDPGAGLTPDLVASLPGYRPELRQPGGMRELAGKIHGGRTVPYQDRSGRLRQRQQTVSVVEYVYTVEENGVRSARVGYAAATTRARWDPDQRARIPNHVTVLEPRGGLHAEEQLSAHIRSRRGRSFRWGINWRNTGRSFPCAGCRSAIQSVGGGLVETMDDTRHSWHLGCR